MTTPATKSLVLASSSKFRRELLERLQLPYYWKSPGIVETRKENESIPEMCARLALEKARALSTDFPRHLIVGCDQSATVDTQQLNKPGTMEKAFQQLKLLSGQKVTFFTAIALLDTAGGRETSAMDETTVNVRNLSDQEINRYLERERPLDSAGSFMVEKLGISLFTSVATTDPTALIGLPLIKLCALLRENGFLLP